VLLPSSSLLRSHHHLPAVVELAPSSRGAFPSRFPSFEGDALKRGTEARGETLPPPPMGATMPASAEMSAAVLVAAVRSGDSRTLNAELSKRAPFPYGQQQPEEGRTVDR